MTEPSSTTAGGFALWKLGTAILGIGVIAAALGFLVMLPRTPKEAAVRSLATLLGSVIFGPILVFFAYQQWPAVFAAGNTMAVTLGLEPWLGTMAAAAPLLAIGGLPCWWILGAIALWLDKRKGKDIAEIAADARADIGKVVGG